MDLADQLFRHLQREVASAERIGGAVIGVVTGNQDPDKLGRVQVRLPMFGDQDSTWWAPVISAGAGKQRGWFFIPEIDDEVVVMFEHGDVNHPVVVGALWSKDDAPADSNGGDNERRVIKSRAGSRLIFDDDKQLLIIEDGGGKGRVTLDADKNLITIEALDGDVAVQAPAGAFTLVADKAVLKAGGNLTISSGDGMTIAGDAGVTIKAGSAMAISGSTVDINNGGAKSAQAPQASPAAVADPYGNG